jgi:hypothetical protein
MNIRKFAQIAVIAASVTLVGAAHAAKGNKAGGRAAGKVSKIDVTAKTFVVSNKKKGDTTVSFDDKTTFKKAGEGEGAAAVDAKVTDLKEGGRAIVSGKMEDGKLIATSVTMGGRRKKAAQ